MAKVRTGNQSVREVVDVQEGVATAGAVDAYVAGFSEPTRAVLAELRDLVRAAVPGATETMAYGIPTFDLHGKHVVHVAGYARHVGLYPTPSGMEAFETELAPFRSGKGTARFPLDAPLPADLIRRIVVFRVGEVEATAKRGRPKGSGGC